MHVVCEAHLHVKNANSRGVWGHAPPENFEILILLRLNLRGFLLIYSYTIDTTEFSNCSQRLGDIDPTTMIYVNALVVT